MQQPQEVKQLLAELAGVVEAMGSLREEGMYPCDLPKLMAALATRIRPIVWKGAVDLGIIDVVCNMAYLTSKGERMLKDLRSIIAKKESFKNN